jgi:predicted outer membrane repeat protein
MAAKSYLRTAMEISLLMLVPAFSVTARAKTIYVDDDGLANFNNIQAAIDDSNDGDMIVVNDGIYTGHGNRDIVMVKSITVKSENGPENCIIDCQGTPIHKHRGFYLGGDPNTILEGFTIINGYHQNGAAIDVYNFDRPVITNCIIRSNSAEEDGGGIYIPWYGCAKLTNCTFLDNTAGRNGGGIASRGSVIAINCKFKRNSAGEHGGGTYDLYSWPTFLLNCTFSGNSANLFGGGVYTHESHTILTNCTLTANIAWHGGGIYYDDDSFLASKNCIVWANSDSSGTGELAQIWATDTVYINYCCVQGWTGDLSEFVGTGNTGNDPCFTEPAYWDPNGTPEDANDDFWVDGDFHLKSQAGRYKPDTKIWVQDNVTSLCIDAGDMGSPIGFEPFPNGGIINMGAYGGTDEASKSYFGEPVCQTIVAGDINHDCKVNFKDFAFLAYNWLVDYEQFVCPQCPIIED